MTGDEQHCHHMESIGNAAIFSPQPAGGADQADHRDQSSTQQPPRQLLLHGSLAGGKDDVLTLPSTARRPACQQDRRCFYTAEVLKQPRPRDLIHHSDQCRWPWRLATDALVMGGKLTDISESTMAKLNEILPGPWSHNNPIDTWETPAPNATPNHCRLPRQTPTAMVVGSTPQDMTGPDANLQELRKPPQLSNINRSSPVGWVVLMAAARRFNRAISAFPYPDTATQVFNTCNMPTTSRRFTKRRNFRSPTSRKKPTANTPPN